MRKQYIILIVILSSSLFLLSYLFLLSTSNHQTRIVLFHPRINNTNHNPGDFINIGFSAFAYEQAKLHETELQNEYDITAVLLHWKRLEGVRNTLPVSSSNASLQTNHHLEQ